MSNQDELETGEHDIDHHLMMGEALTRLRENKDFKTVIMEGYLEQKVLASVSLLAVPAIKKRGERPEVMEDLIAASNLQYFFQLIDGMYEGAKTPTLSDQEEAELEADSEEGVS